MTTMLKAKFDGKVLIPLAPVQLPIGPELDVTVAGPPLPAEGKTTLEQLADELDACSPPPPSPGDLSAQHDHYLYGTPKREQP